MANPKGRPQTNVFQAYSRKTGRISKTDKPNLESRRALYLKFHKTWGDNPELRFRLKSFRFEEEKRPDWELYRAAELAMVVMGRKYPEKIFERNRPDLGDDFHASKMLNNYWPLDHEVMHFLRWCRNHVKRNYRPRNGVKPDPEVIFKTALSALVAKKVKQPKGGNSHVMPTAREISQIWYILFGELESHEAIRSRLKRTGEFCGLYARDHEDWSASGGKGPRYIPGLGRAIMRNHK